MITKSYYNISERKVLLRLVDILLIIFGLFLSSHYFNFNYFSFSNDFIYSWILLLIFYYLIFGQIFMLYNLTTSNNRYTVFRSINLTAYFTTIFYVFTPFISPQLPLNRLQIVYLFLILSLPGILWRFLYIWFFFSTKYSKNIFFIGKSDKIKNLLIKVNDDNIHNVKGYLSDKKLDNVANFHEFSGTQLSSIIKNNISEIIVSLSGFPSETKRNLNRDLILLFSQGINIVSYEAFYEDIMSRVPIENLKKSFYKYLNFSKNSHNRFYLLSLRLLDIILSIIGLIILFSIVPFLFFVNLFANKGPLFYSQQRVGKMGKVFKIYKLRSMVVNAELNGAVWAKKNDIRITNFGRLLRSTRCDELPQFYNVLRGDMSIIGPRPERPEFVKELTETIPFYKIRHLIRPGLTGWAQVKYPYANSVKEQEVKLLYDLYYIKQRNIVLDFKIIIKTITTVLFYRGQ